MSKKKDGDAIIADALSAHIKGKRISSYQKLKMENFSLKQQLTVIAQDPGGTESIIIIMKWKMKVDLANVFWMGSVQKEPQKLQGIIAQMALPPDSVTVFCSNCQKLSNVTKIIYETSRYVVCQHCRSGIPCPPRN